MWVKTFYSWNVLAGQLVLIPYSPQSCSKRAKSAPRVLLLTYTKFVHEYEKFRHYPQNFEKPLLEHLKTINESVIVNSKLFIDHHVRMPLKRRVPCDRSVYHRAFTQNGIHISHLVSNIPYDELALPSPYDTTSDWTRGSSIFALWKPESIFYLSQIKSQILHSFMKYEKFEMRNS